MISAKIKVFNVKKYEKDTTSGAAEVHDKCFDFVAVPRAGDWVDLRGTVCEVRRIMHSPRPADAPASTDGSDGYQMFIIVEPLPVGHRMY